MRKATGARRPKGRDKRPAVFAGVAGLVLVALTLGALNFKPTFDLSSAGIPSGAESEVALTVLERGLPPGATEPTQVYLHATSGTLAATEVSGYGAKLKSMSGVGAVAAPVVSNSPGTACEPPARAGQHHDRRP